MRRLLERGNNPNKANDSGETPLHFAAFFGNAEATRLLLEKGADTEVYSTANSYTNAYYPGSTPLHYALWFDRDDVVDLLVGHGANLNAADRDVGRAPLAIAAQRNNAEAVALLISEGASVDKARAIYNGAIGGGADALRAIFTLAPSTDPNETGSFGEPAICAAVRNSFQDVVTVLIEFGADIEAIDRDDSGYPGFRPLHIAALVGNGAIVDQLLAAGASRDQVVEDISDWQSSKRFVGLTPIEVAVLNGHSEVAKRFRE